MGSFTSLCHATSHEDKIDVAYSCVTDEIRLTVWQNELNDDVTVYLSVDDANHLMTLVNIAQMRVKEAINGLRWSN